ncbi:MAG: ABC-2 type transport system permease protein [Roseivirga sp.]|jgi:ABC-2 type transport system permease protein
MNQIFLVLKREYVTRVKKKSFLLATLLTPLILPSIIFVIVYFGTKDKTSNLDDIIVVDQSGYFTDAFNESGYEFEYMTGSLDDGKAAMAEKEAFGLIFIPPVDLEDKTKTSYEGFAFYSKTNPSFRVLQDFEKTISSKLGDVKLERSGLDQEVLKSLDARVSLESFNLTDEGEESKSNAGLSYAIGYGTGFLIYIFIFVYGSQIMQSVLDEKTSRIVEVIVSSVRPFHLMMGKVLGVGAVGFTQLLIWIVLIGGLSTVGISVLGGGSQEVMDAMAQGQSADLTQGQEMAVKIQEMLNTIPVGKILFSFLFFFLGAYFLYGALYAAVGSAVDSIQDAQQFMLPIVLPILAAIMSMFFVLEDPNGGLAVTLSLIPFTSPIIMMARIPFGVPDWQLALSMVLLVVGFVGTIWLAGRIYRIGILMYGVKVNWKIIAKWFTMKV